MKITFFFLFSFLLWSCQPGSTEKQTSVDAYYPLDSLLASQKELLLGRPLHKSVTIGNQSESEDITVSLDFLKKEWGFLGSFDLNKPALVGAIETTETDSSITYRPKPKEKVLLDQLTFMFDSLGQPRQISGSYVDEKAEAIYGSYRSFSLSFQNGLINEYTIRGFQKIVMKDTVFFEVSAQFQ